MEMELIQEEPDKEEVPQDPEKKKERLYIGSKLILASKMDQITFLLTEKNTEINHGNAPGYKVIYPDGYVSWSPKEAFETAYREVTLKERALF